MQTIAQALRSRLNFAQVVSVIALMVALGGTSYAISLGKNSVGAREIERNAVHGAEVKNATLRERELSFEAVAEHELDILSNSSDTRRTPRGQTNESDDPVLLPPDGSFTPILSLALPPDFSEPVVPTTRFQVTAFVQSFAEACNGPVSVTARIAVADPDVPELPDQSVPGIPDMRADLNDTAGIGAAPISLGGVFLVREPTEFDQPQIALLARAEYGQDARPGCVEITGRNVSAIQLSE